MKILTALIILLPLFNAHGAKSEKPLALDRGEPSPQWTFRVECGDNPTNGLHQIWISDFHDPTHRVLQYEYERAATVCVSPDEKWLVVNDYAGSNTAHPILFRRNRGIQFSPLKDVDLEKIAWDAAAVNQGFPASQVFDHQYSEVLCWLGDSGKVIIRAWGYYSGEYSLDEWFCIYDVNSGKVSFDLSNINAGSYRVIFPAGKPKPKAPEADKKDPHKAKNETVKMGSGADPLRDGDHLAGAAGRAGSSVSSRSRFSSAMTLCSQE